MPKKVHEPTQAGNPRQLTIGQHVHSRWCISKFVDGTGLVGVLRRGATKAFPAAPENRIFCAMRVWDQQAEEGFFKGVEDAFHAEVDDILRVGAVKNHEVVSEYLAVWEVRARFKESPPKDAELVGVAPQALTKDEQEILESKWYGYARGTMMPGRRVAGLRAVRFVDQHMWHYKGIRWGLARASSLPGFICPDRPASTAFIPIDRKHALVARWKDLKVTGRDVERLNGESWTQAQEYIFGHPNDVLSFVNLNAARGWK